LHCQLQQLQCTRFPARHMQVPQVPQELQWSACHKQLVHRSFPIGVCCKWSNAVREHSNPVHSPMQRPRLHAVDPMLPCMCVWHHTRRVDANCAVHTQVVWRRKCCYQHACWWRRHSRRLRTERLRRAGAATELCDPEVRGNVHLPMRTVWTMRIRQWCLLRNRPNDKEMYLPDVGC
jgi:hypothetical protein